MQRGEIHHTDTRTDSTGRHQPARKPRTKRTAGAAPTAAEPAQSREEIPHADGESVYEASQINLAEPPAPGTEVDQSTAVLTDPFHPALGYVAEFRSLVSGALAALPFDDWPMLMRLLGEEFAKLQAELIRDPARSDRAIARDVGVSDRVHASNRSDSKARPTNTRLGLETGAYLSADEALKLPDLV